MSGKDVGGDFFAGFTGELRRLVIVQGQHKKAQEEQRRAKEYAERTQEQPHHPESRVIHSQR